MKQILILALSDLRHDARISRQISFLKKDYHVTVVCFESNGLTGFEVVKIHRTKLTLWRKAIAGLMLLAGMYIRGHRLLYDYGFLKKMLSDRTFDLVVANDIESLPFAFEYKNAKVLFDAHEYAPRHFEDKLMWRIFFQGLNEHLCKVFIPRTHAMTTVGRGLAEEYEKNFKVRPAVITNATTYFNVEPVRPRNGKIRMIHHGGANPSRRLEIMIDLMEHLDTRFTLDMMLITPPLANRKTKEYLNMLKRRSEKNPRVRILPPIRSSEIVPFINQYDIGVFLLPPINFNYAHTLPNKLFDFIQARLAVAIGPTPEMAEIVNSYQLGVVSQQFTSESLAHELNKLTLDQLISFKNHATTAAKALNAEVNETLLKDLVRSLFQ